MTLRVSKTRTPSVAFAALLSFCSVLSLFAIDCTGKNTGVLNPTAAGSPTESATTLPLRTLRDIPLGGGATRFDYQSIDSDSGRLYIAHLGDNTLSVFDTQKEVVLGEVKTLSRVHGVLSVPELHRVFASATGTN